MRPFPAVQRPMAASHHVRRLRRLRVDPTRTHQARAATLTRRYMRRARGVTA